MVDSVMLLDYDERVVNASRATLGFETGEDETIATVRLSAGCGTAPPFLSSAVRDGL